MLNYKISKRQGMFFALFLFTFISFSVSAQVVDTASVFRDITDIEKLLRKDSIGNQAVPVVRPRENDVPRKDISFPTLRRKTFALDSLYRRKANGTLELPDNSLSRQSMDGLTFVDTIFYNPLFLPMIFTGKILPSDLSFYPPKDKSVKGLLIPQDQTFAKQLRRADFVQKTRRDFYREYPDRVEASVYQMDTLPVLTTDKDVTGTFNPLKELISSETSFSLDVPQIEGVEIARKYWVFNGEHTLQLSQAYFSPNWHKGGISNFNVINNHVLKWNYKKNKIRFNNTLEWKLSVFTAPDDSIRSMKLGEDLVRYFGDFGIDAFIKKWAYSANVDMRTQLFNNYPTNSTVLRSAFASPLYITGGLGFKYNLDKKSKTVRHRRTRIDAFINPLGFSFRYVGNDKVDKKRFGIEEGHNYNYDWGSTLGATLIYDFNKYITLNSRFRYFTSYKKVEAELENTLNMALTSAFSTRFYLHLRYDDAVPADSKFKHLQVSELLSFGLNYKW